MRAARLANFSQLWLIKRLVNALPSHPPLHPPLPSYPHHHPPLSSSLTPSPPSLPSHPTLTLLPLQVNALTAEEGFLVPEFHSHRLYFRSDVPNATETLTETFSAAPGITGDGTCLRPGPPGCGQYVKTRPPTKRAARFLKSWRPTEM